MTEIAEQIASPYNACCYKEQCVAAHQEREAATRRAEQAEAHAAALREALEGAQEWLQGWASAEPYLSRIDRALAAEPATSLAVLRERYMLKGAEIAYSCMDAEQAAAAIRKLAEGK